MINTTQHMLRNEVMWSLLLRPGLPGIATLSLLATSMKPKCCGSKASKANQVDERFWNLSIWNFGPLVKRPGILASQAGILAQPSFEKLRGSMGSYVY